MTPNDSKAYTSQHPDNKQADPYKGGTGGITAKERAEMFFLRGRNSLLPGLPGIEADGHLESGRINTLASG